MNVTMLTSVLLEGTPCSVTYEGHLESKECFAIKNIY